MHHAFSNVFQRRGQRSACAIETRAVTRNADPVLLYFGAGNVHPAPNEVNNYELTFITENDPSAGSPTETLLRLLLPLDDQVWASSRPHGRSQRPV